MKFASLSHVTRFRAEVGPTNSDQSADPKIAWSSDFGSTIALLRGPSPDGPAWHALLDRLHTKPRPLLIRMLDAADLDASQRRDLADAIGTRVPVSLVADSEQARGLGKALSWFGVCVEVFAVDDSADAAQRLSLDPALAQARVAGLTRAGHD